MNNLDSGIQSVASSNISIQSSVSTQFTTLTNHDAAIVSLSNQLNVLEANSATTTQLDAGLSTKQDVIASNTLPGDDILNSSIAEVKLDAAVVMKLNAIGGATPAIGTVLIPPASQNKTFR